MKMIGVELYFDDLEGAKRFYCDTLGLTLSDEEAGHHAQFDAGAGFLCLESKGAESYPSRDKAVLFFEVDDLNAAVKAVGPERVVQWEKKPGSGNPVGGVSRSRRPQRPAAAEEALILALTRLCDILPFMRSGHGVL